MCFGRAMRDFALPPPPSVPLPSSPPLQNKNHHCTGKTHSLQKTTAIRISSPFCDVKAGIVQSREKFRLESGIVQNGSGGKKSSGGSLIGGKDSGGGRGQGKYL